MRLSTVAVFATFGSLALAQSLLDNLPQCARTCFGNNFAQCRQLDIACICGNKQLISDLSCCIFQGCSAEDQESTIKLAVDLCKANGVDVPTSASCASTASATASGSSSGSATGSAVSGSTTPAVTNVSGTSGASGASASPTAQSAAGGSTGAAAPLPTAGAGLGMAMAGLLMAL